MSGLDLDPWLPPYPSLADRLWTPEGSSPRLRLGVLLGGSLVLLVGAAKANVPFWPVPLSLFPMAVLLTSSVLGLRLGLLAVCLYLVLGVGGLPVFAAAPERGNGFSYLLGPEGGYLIGALAAVIVVGIVSRQGWDREARGVLFAVAFGMALQIVCGAGWLMWIAGVEEAWRGAVLPFLFVFFAEVFIVTFIVSTAWRLSQRRNRWF